MRTAAELSDTAVGMQRISRAVFLLVAIVGLVILTLPGKGHAQVMNSGWHWPTGSGNFCGYLGWLGYNSGWGYHLAQDMCNGAGEAVYSIGNGEVISSGEHGGYGCNGSCTGGCVLARYRAADATWFTAMYGHLDSYVGTGTVIAGQIIGYTLSDWSPPHLHFSIHPGFNPEPANPWRGYTSSTSNLYGFTDPIPFLNAHPAPGSCSPDPNNIWLDFGWDGPYTGCQQSPFDDMTAAITALNAGGVLHIKPGTSTWTGTISKPMTLQAEGGTVTIGQ